jgi:hypothetical protein
MFTDDEEEFEDEEPFFPDLESAFQKKFGLDEEDFVVEREPISEPDVNLAAEVSAPATPFPPSSLENSLELPKSSSAPALLNLPSTTPSTLNQWWLTVDQAEIERQMTEVAGKLTWKVCSFFPANYFDRGMLTLAYNLSLAGL